MLTFPWKSVRFYASEFFASFIFGYVIFFGVLSLDHFPSISFILLGSVLSTTAIIVLITCLEPECLVHLNPAYTLAEFCLKRYLNERFDVRILLILMGAQYSGFICSAVLINNAYTYDKQKIHAIIESQKVFNSNSNNNSDSKAKNLFGEFVFTILNTVVSLRSRRRYVFSPVNIGLITSAIAIASDAPTLRMFNPASAVASKILFRMDDSIVLVVVEYVSSIVGFVIYVLLFRKKY